MVVTMPSPSRGKEYAIPIDGHYDSNPGVRFQYGKRNPLHLPSP